MLVLVIRPHSTPILMISLLLLLLLELHLTLILLTLLLSFPLRLLLSLLLIVFLFSLLSYGPVTRLESQVVELWLRNRLRLFRSSSRLKLLEQKLLNCSLIHYKLITETIIPELSSRY